MSAPDKAVLIQESSPTKEFRAPRVEQPAQQVIPASTGLSPLVMAVVNGQLTTEQMKEMLDIQAQYEAMEAKKAFHDAMAEFKKDAPAVVKDMVNKQYGSGYTSKGELFNTINPYLGKHGLSTSHQVKQENGLITVTCVLTHRLGYSESVPMSAPPDKSGAKNPLQEIKSTKTYLEIATYEAVTGIASGNSTDDDGNGSGGSGNKSTGDGGNVSCTTYNEDQKATFDKIIREEDAIALYLLSTTIDRKIWIDLYNSGGKGEKVALKKSCDDLVRVGHNMVKNIETALGNSDAILAIENYDCSAIGEGLLRRHLGKEGIDNLNDMIKIEE